MSTLLVTHVAAATAHQVPAGFPERPDRIRAIEAVLGGPDFAGLVRQEAPEASLDTVAAVHDRAFVEAIVAASPERGLVMVGPETTMSPGTLAAILRGVGGATAAVDAVVSGAARNAFSAMRPPGHHAERDTAMGFCIFNSAAAAARHAQRRHGVERVAIVDWDVHHGNGTQDIFWSDPSVLYCSTHQMPLFPGTGAASERGEYGTVVNVPLRAGTTGPVFREAMRNGILPRLEAFRPDLLVVSAGFDAHKRDPLANLMLDEDDFAWATREVMAVADRHCGGRLVSVLEGGYDLQALADSTAAHVRTLMDA